MKTRKIILMLMIPAMMLGLIVGCDKEDEAITYSMTDVSSRITGLSNSQIGAGQPLTVNGSGLDALVRIMVGNTAIPARQFTNVSASSVTFSIPSNAPLGDNQILYVFPGPDRGFGEVEIVPLQVASGFTPYAAGTGETVTITGLLLDLVEEVKLGAVSATIASKSANTLRFTVPGGITTGPITLISPYGTTTTAALATPNLTACETAPANSDCSPGVNLNAGFELGDGDNFTNWNKFNGGTIMLATTVAGEVFAGSRAMKVVRDGTLASGEWRIQLASDLTPMDVGASYTVYVWARATNAGGSMRVSTAPTALYTGNQDVPTTWTRLAFTFTANETPARVVLDMNGNQTVATTFFIDDVKLIKN